MSKVPETLHGRLPMSSPFQVKEGQCLMKLEQKRGEGRDEAIERVENVPWFGRIINMTPRFFKGYWVWLCRKE